MGGEVEREREMKLRGAIAVVRLAIPAVSVTSAHAASTPRRVHRAGGPDLPVVRGPGERCRYVIHQELQTATPPFQVGTLKAFTRQNRRTARSLNALAEVKTRMTDQIVAVPPPDADVGTIAGWLDSRRRADSFARSAALALKKLNANRFFKQLGQADKAADAGSRAISGFGFQVCGMSVLS